MKNLAKLSTVMSVVVVLAVLAGCNTIQGFGKDISAGGSALANAAKKVKNGSHSSNQSEQVKTAPVKDAAFQSDIKKTKN